jgi:F-type H+-transporting ATPase subunit b
MKIDWFTFGAQIVNFLVLVWLLKRFLYKPVISAMDDREQRIAARLEDAARAREEAENESRAFREKTEELKHAKEQLMEEASREVESWKQEHLDQARADVEESEKEWFRAIERERSSFLQDLRRRAGVHVYETAREVLAKLSGAELQEQIVDEFLEKLDGLDAGTVEEIVAALRETKHKVLVRSAFELTEPLRERLRDAAHRQFKDEIEVGFEVVPEIVCGVELQAAGFKIAWSVGESMNGLAEDFERAIEQAGTRVAPS